MRHMVLAMCVAGALPAVAQSPAQASKDPARDAMRGGFAEVTGWVTKAADLVPADKFTYRPTSTVRTFGQLVAHVADGANYYCGLASGKRTEWTDAVEKGPLDKTTAIQKLKQSLAACDAQYSGSGQVGPLMANVAHMNLHYGNIITYMRMLGLTPPSS